jgi:uncharacterized protein YecE (DUF72 family)
LGAILFQTPPTLPFDRGRIENFLGFLPPMHRYAFEFRHPSWEAAREVLASQGAAWCVAETDASPVGDASIPSEPFAYLRLRKLEYSDDELQAWAKRVSVILEADRDVFCYFKHEEKGAGPIYAERMASLVRGGSRTGSTEV